MSISVLSAFNQNKFIDFFLIFHRDDKSNSIEKKLHKHSKDPDTEKWIGEKSTTSSERFRKSKLTYMFLLIFALFYRFKNHETKANGIKKEKVELRSETLRKDRIQDFETSGKKSSSEESK